MLSGWRNVGYGMHLRQVEHREALLQQDGFHSDRREDRALSTYG
jgi:hypothetical protein